MTLLALLLALHIGTVTPAGPGVFERVAERRVQWGQVAEEIPVACLVATNDDRVGSFVVVLTPAGFEACYVVDVARPDHAIERKMHNETLEADYETYHRWASGRVATPFR
jgi:hypothetical protein